MTAPRALLTVEDLEPGEITRVLARAAALRAGETTALAHPPLLGLLFLETSLRTRLGFAAAAARLGGSSVDVFERRASEVSTIESWGDTLRVVSGMVDLVVARAARPLRHADCAASLAAPLLNAGDTGPAAQHPSQALADVFAMQQLLGPVSELTVAVVGDLRMRAARSLLALLGRLGARRIVTIGDPRLGSPPVTGTWRQPWEVADVDVLYVVGIPHGALDEPGRTRLRVDGQVLAALPDTAVVLSPMPVIDEIAAAARFDPRVRMHAQSDDAVYVRMALIELLLG